MNIIQTQLVQRRKVSVEKRGREHGVMPWPVSNITNAYRQILKKRGGERKVSGDVW